MTNKKQKAIIMIIIFIAVAFTLLFIILPSINYVPSEQGEDEKPKNLDELPGFNESQRLALERVENSYQYQNYNPSNLKLISTEQDLSKNLWSFTYQFDINSSQAPSNIKSIQILVHVKDGDLQNTTLTEIPYK